MFLLFMHIRACLKRVIDLVLPVPGAIGMWKGESQLWCIDDSLYGHVLNVELVQCIHTYI